MCKRGEAGIMAPQWVKEYCEKHELQKMFEEAANAVVKARAEEPAAFLKQLQGSGVEMVVCSKGLVGVIQKCLEDLNLRDYFTAIYANIGY